MRVIISGGGIGGLTLAAALPDFDVCIVEKRSSLSGIGAGIMLRQKALDILAKHGVEICGRPFEQIVLGAAGSKKRIGTKRLTVALCRQELHHALFARCQHAKVMTSTIVSSFNVNGDGVDVVLSTGEKMRADVLVGSDGLSSNVRKLVGANSNIRFSGYTCWRALAEIDSGLDHPLELWGRGGRVGIVPLNEGTYIYLTLNTAPGGFNEPVPFTKFHEFGSEVVRLIESVPPKNWSHRDIEELDRHNWGQLRVPLLGDAAHGFTPNLGEGAVQAIFDADHLAQSLRGDMANYPGSRRGMVSLIAYSSRWIGRVAQAESFGARMRDSLINSLGRRRSS